MLLLILFFGMCYGKFTLEDPTSSMSITDYRIVGINNNNAIIDN